MDIAGIDILAHVVGNLAERLPSDALRREFALPALVAALVERGWLGEKSGPRLLQARQDRGRHPRS